MQPEVLLEWGNRLWNRWIGLELVIKDKRKWGRYRLLMLFCVFLGVAGAVIAGISIPNRPTTSFTRQPMLASPSRRWVFCCFLFLWGGIWFSHVFLMLYRPDLLIRWSNWVNRWTGLETIVIDKRKLGCYYRWMGLFLLLVGLVAIVEIVSAESV